MDLTNEEKAALIRTMLASKGWALFDTFVGQKFEMARDQAFMSEAERHPDFKDWSMDKLTGFVMGTGFARKGLRMWLDQWDAMERAAAEKSVEEPAHGHPYVDDTNPAGVAQG